MKYQLHTIDQGDWPDNITQNKAMKADLSLFLICIFGSGFRARSGGQGHGST